MASSAILEPVQIELDTQRTNNGLTFPGGQAPIDDQAPYAAGILTPDDHDTHPLDTAGEYLGAYASALEQLEDTRKAIDGQLWQINEKGIGVLAPQYAPLVGLSLGLRRPKESPKGTPMGLEDLAVKALELEMKAHPLGPWVMAQTGIGLKMGARLLAAIGNPLYNKAAKRPRRGPAELWQYCGHGDPERSKRRKGQRVEYCPEAKMRVHLVAEKCVMAGVRRADDCDDSDGYDLAHRYAISPYGQTYLDARAAWAERDTTDGHKHNHALRVTAKAILRDIWCEARALTE